MTRALGYGLLAAATVLAALTVLTAYFMRDNLFRELVKPDLPYQVSRPPPAPDYRTPRAWAMQPAGAAGQGVDVFFIPPTTDLDDDAWNAAYDDPAALAQLRMTALPNHAAPFADGGALWVPLYRQATLFASLSHREDARDALQFAYGDVKRAFAAFLAQTDPQRGMILAGYGQGGLHLVRLLAEDAARPAVRQRLVAAYVMKQPVPAAWLAPGGPLAWLPLCDAPTAHGCLVTYSTVDAGDERDLWLLRERSVVWRADGQVEGLNGRPIACVNPLTGDVNAPDAKPRLNMGSAAASGLEPGLRPALLPAETGARCVDGALVVEVNRPAVLQRPVFMLGARYLTARYNLFYANLAADAQTRATAWRAARSD